MSTEANREQPNIILSYLRLFRLPNVFTAWADVMMGFFVTHPKEAVGGQILLIMLIACTSLLYTAGMVLNDVFDVEIDRAERPNRPLPSGAIPMSVAKILGFGMLIAGVGLAWFLTNKTGDLRSGVVASILAVMIVGYNAFFKNNFLGPFAMGSCRMLNVLLGMSLASTDGGVIVWDKFEYLVALSMGVYIVGVTFFAKDEASAERKWPMIVGAFIMILAFCMFISLPYFKLRGFASSNWYILMGILSLFIVYRTAQAIGNPSPAKIQDTIKKCIFSLIFFNAAICMMFGAGGQAYAYFILLLFAPMLILGKFVYST